MPDEAPQLDAGNQEIERLRADLEQARRRTSEAEARADTLEMQVSNASSRAASAQLAQVTAQEISAADAITSIDGELRGLKSQLASLTSEGKFVEAADLQEKIGDATARRRQAMQSKDYFADQKTRIAAQPTNPVDVFLNQNQGQYSAEDQAWIRQNPRFATDAAFRGRVIAAHGAALGQGLRQRSPEYFQHLEQAAYMREPPASVGAAAAVLGVAVAPVEPPAPTGHSGGDPRSSAAETDLDGDGVGPGPEIIIKEPDMPQATTGEAFNRRADNPQPRAAGTGSLRAAVAAAPTRRSVTEAGRRIQMTFTPGERETALAMAPHIFPDALAGGEQAILAAYDEWRRSPAAERVRQGWVDRRGG